MFVYQKTLFDRYYCIKCICHLKTVVKNTYKSTFLYYYNGVQKHAGFVGFENACSRVKTYVILMSINYVHFYQVTVDDVGQFW